MDEVYTYVRDDGFIVIQRFMLAAECSTDYEASNLKNAYETT